MSAPESYTTNIYLQITPENSTLKLHLQTLPQHYPVKLRLRAIPKTYILVLQFKSMLTKYESMRWKYVQFCRYAGRTTNPIITPFGLPFPKPPSTRLKKIFDAYQAYRKKTYPFRTRCRFEVRDTEGDGGHTHDGGFLKTDRHKGRGWNWEIFPKYLAVQSCEIFRKASTALFCSCSFLLLFFFFLLFFFVVTVFLDLNKRAQLQGTGGVVGKGLLGFELDRGGSDHTNC